MSKGWDPTFLIRAISLSEKLVISFVFFFSDLGLKSRNPQVHPTKVTCFLVKCFFISDLFLDNFPHVLQVNALNVFSTWKITYIELAFWNCRKNKKKTEMRKHLQEDHDFFVFPIADFYFSNLCQKRRNQNQSPVIQINQSLWKETLDPSTFMRKDIFCTAGNTTLNTYYKASVASFLAFNGPICISLQ